jgi:hypothetical protein
MAKPVEGWGAWRDPAEAKFIQQDDRWRGGLRRGYSNPQAPPPAPLPPPFAPQPEWSVVDGINETMRLAASRLSPEADAERQRLITKAPRPSDILFGSNARW